MPGYDDPTLTKEVLLGIKDCPPEMLAAPQPITLHDNLEFNTTTSTEGVIDLSEIDIVSGGGTEDFYDLSILAGTGDIVLGDIGLEADGSAVRGGTRSRGCLCRNHRYRIFGW